MLLREVAHAPNLWHDLRGHLRIILADAVARQFLAHISDEREGVQLLGLVGATGTHSRLALGQAEGQAR